MGKARQGGCPEGSRCESFCITEKTNLHRISCASKRWKRSGRRKASFFVKRRRRDQPIWNIAPSDRGGNPVVLAHKPVLIRRNRTMVFSGFCRGQKEDQNTGYGWIKMHIILYRKMDIMMYQFINESGRPERCTEAHGTEPVVTAKNGCFGRIIW